MLKNKISYYFWRVAIGVSIGLILMFARSNAFALTYDLKLQDEYYVFTSNKRLNIVIGNSSSVTDSNALLNTTVNFNSNYLNVNSYEYAVFPIASIIINNVSGNNVSNVLSDINFRIQLITSAGPWSTCELQNNFIVCPINPNLTYTSLRFYYTRLVSGPDASITIVLNNTMQLYNGQISGIANSSQESAEANKQTSQNTKKIADEVSDNSDPSIDVSGMSGVQGLLPPGPLDSLLGLPVNLLNILVNATSGTCEPFTFTFVFDSEWSLPCFDTFWNEVPTTLLLFMSDLPAVYIFIKWAKSIYKRVERAVSFESSVDDEWGGV